MNLTRPPLYVFELQSRHLAGTQSQAGKEQKNRVIAATDGRAAIAVCQDFFHLTLADVFGETIQRAARNRWYKARQVGLHLTFLGEKAEEELYRDLRSRRAKYRWPDQHCRRQLRL